MSQDITRKRLSRKAHKSHATRASKGITDILLTADYEDEAQMVKLQGFVENYKQQFGKIQILDEEIVGLVKEEEIEIEISKTLEEYEEFHMLIVKAKACLDKAKTISVKKFHPSTHIPTSSTALKNK